MALASIAAVQLDKLRHAYDVGQLDRAREIQLSLAQISEIIEVCYGIPGLKYAMDQIGMYGGPVRRPLQPLDDQGKAEIDSLLTDLKTRYE